jgi:hypothetical protein
VFLHGETEGSPAPPALQTLDFDGKGMEPERLVQLVGSNRTYGQQ